MSIGSENQSRERGLAQLPKSSMGLCMQDDVIQVAVGLHLGALLCASHQCRHCRAMVHVDHRGTYGLHCTFSKGSHPRHAALNDIIKRALDAAKIPILPKPTGLYQLDRMASELMEPPLFLGEVGKCWCEMPPAPIHCHLRTQAWPQEKQMWWQTKPRRRRPSMPATICPHRR